MRCRPFSPAAGPTVRAAALLLRVARLLIDWRVTKRLSSDAGTGRLEPDDQAERACGEPPPAELILAVRQFNRGEYFEQHETLELLWRREPRRIRRLYQGVLLVGAGLHHLRRGNYHGALALMQRGMRRLAPFSPQCQGVDVADLIARTTVA